MKFINRLSVFENKMLRRMVGPATQEVTWRRRKLYNEEIYVAHCSHYWGDEGLGAGGR
jgi:hypothetical protein